jgi:hypothetical protein
MLKNTLYSMMGSFGSFLMSPGWVVNLRLLQGPQNDISHLHMIHSK